MAKTAPRDTYDPPPRRERMDVRHLLRSAESIEELEGLMSEAQGIEGPSTKTRRRWAEAYRIRLGQLQRIEELKQDQRDVAALKGEARS